MYEPLITGNSCVSEDLYSLGEMILCVESSCPCQTCSEEMAKYGEKIIPEIFNLARIWAKYVKENKNIYLKSVFEDYDLKKISEIVNFQINI